MKKRIGVIVESRSNSKRLPNKILLKVANETLLEHLIAKLKLIKDKPRVIIATTNNISDDKICKIARKKKVSFFRGSENNVMKRVIDAALKFKLTDIIQITSDCPLIDVNLVDQFLEIYKSHEISFLSNCVKRSYPDGMDIRITNLKDLIKSSKMTKKKFDYEHVTTHIQRNPKIFKNINILAPTNLYYPNLGLTLDEINDYILIKKIILYFTKKKKKYTYNCQDILSLLSEKKGWIKINKNVKRKAYQL